VGSSLQINCGAPARFPWPRFNLEHSQRHPSSDSARLGPEPHPTEQLPKGICACHSRRTRPLFQKATCKREDLNRCPPGPGAIGRSGQKPQKL